MDLNEESYSQESSIMAAHSMPSEDSFIQEEIDVPVELAPQRTVGLLELIFISFFCVSGGSYGLEDAVSSGYPLFAILGLLILPWIWSLPAALMTAELSTALPENGGYIIWTKRAFGPFWSFQTGYWSWLNNLFDNAVYPVMFVDYLSPLIGEVSLFEKLVIVAILISFITLANISGIEIVGKMSILFTIIVIMPFLIMTLWGLPQIDFSAIGKVPKPMSSGNWGLWLSVILWNTSGWDSVGSVAGEVKNPSKTYPKGLILSMLLVIAVYAFPLIVAVSIDQQYSKWVDGYYPEIMGKLGGNGFKIFTTIIGLISTVGLLNVILCTSSRALYAMSTDDMLSWPALGKLHPKFKTPWVSILANSICIFILCIFPFQALVEIDIVLYSLSLAVEFSALVWLRVKEPRLHRPYKIPMSTIGVGAFVTPPLLLCLLSVILTGLKTKLLSVVAVIIGIALYYIIQKIKTWKRKKEANQNFTELQEFFTDKEDENSD